MGVNYAKVGDLKEGNYVVIDGEPCRVVEVSKAKTGKHGAAKANIVAISIFTGSKKTLMAPVDEQIEIPVIEKHVGQILADMNEKIQLMDLDTYETFDIERPKEEDLASKVRPGAEVEYWSIMGRRKIVRVK
ncbi:MULTISPECIES: translation initiation factor IF-5A [Acidianus]|uniref:Translation initiation factor 5A n=1 Tax=Candidatus Acidianus copahuensis TaxID=1160895 RepID=A0A031LMA4_9CREN|nr:MULTISPECIES: translation initiation factor IF-5A [Acidianus]EZQ06778.1 translation initiation factor IF-5A [Candidatus Acidianus copahuensis]NON62157.1 translation initiation factor IF-5A [Acidianus sp. RZ1]